MNVPEYPLLFQVNIDHLPKRYLLDHKASINKFHNVKIIHRMIHEQINPRMIHKQASTSEKALKSCITLYFDK